MLAAILAAVIKGFALKIKEIKGPGLDL